MSLHIGSSLLSGFCEHGFFDRRASELASVGGGCANDSTRLLDIFASSLEGDFWGFASVQQSHSNRVITLTGRDQLWSSEATAANGDSLITTVRGLLVGVYTADCAAVLLTDGEGVCAAVHAGWRGALGGIIDATISGMVSLGLRADGIYAAIGPTIGVASYPVSDDFLSPFLAHEIAFTRDNGCFFTRLSDGWHFDLGGYVRARLRGCGVLAERIDFLGIDTFRERNYFSHRRFLRDGVSEGGRNFSCIALKI